jgi:hypothetical protein
MTLAFYGRRPNVLPPPPFKHGPAAPAGTTADMILRGSNTSPGYFTSPFAGQ